ncbi:MAG TPA: TIGR02391 family protein [Streptosporangiaceae bacterium]|nr:TIGR02391 family protein [Streptosporangiaceae bacterium]
MALDVQRCQADLDDLQAELGQWQTPDAPGLELWKHKLATLIGEIFDPNHALAIRLSGLRWGSSSTSARSRLDRKAGMAGPSEQSLFLKAKQSGNEIIEALRWELDRLAPATAPFADATIDPELWGHVRGLIEAKDWEKVAREAAVFVEDKLRNWAAVPTSVSGSVNVFKAAIGSSGFQLPKAGPASEQQGWQQLAIGFALALRNPSGHQIKNRGDAERYALGVLGTASLLLTELRHEYGDPPKL